MKDPEILKKNHAYVESVFEHLIKPNQNIPDDKKLEQFIFSIAAMLITNADVMRKDIENIYAQLQIGRPKDDNRESTLN